MEKNPLQLENIVLPRINKPLTIKNAIKHKMSVPEDTPRIQSADLAAYKQLS
jgi:hypothetical protein